MSSCRPVATGLRWMPHHRARHVPGQGPESAVLPLPGVEPGKDIDRLVRVKLFRLTGKRRGQSFRPRNHHVTACIAWRGALWRLLFDVSPDETCALSLGFHLHSSLLVFHMDSVCVCVCVCLCVHACSTEQQTSRAALRLPRISLHTLFLVLLFSFCGSPCVYPGSRTSCWGWHCDQHRDLPSTLNLRYVPDGKCAEGGFTLPCTGTSTTRAVRRGVGSDDGPVGQTPSFGST